MSLLPPMACTGWIFLSEYSMRCIYCRAIFGCRREGFFRENLLHGTCRTVHSWRWFPAGWNRHPCQFLLQVRLNYRMHLWWLDLTGKKKNLPGGYCLIYIQRNWNRRLSKRSAFVQFGDCSQLGMMSLSRWVKSLVVSAFLSSGHVGVVHEIGLA